MEIRVLNYFLTVVQEGSITRAAEVLHMTQPTLSRQLSAMEDELNVKLFKRGSRKITLTEQGRQLQKRAEEILQLVEKTKEEVAGCDQIHGHHLSIGCSWNFDPQKAAWLISVLMNCYPNSKIKVMEESNNVIEQKVEDGLLDGAFMDCRLDLAGCQSILLYEKKPMAFMKSDHPCMEKEEIDADDLARYPLAFHDPAEYKDFFQKIQLEKGSLSSDFALAKDSVQYSKDAILLWPSWSGPKEGSNPVLKGKVITGLKDCRGYFCWKRENTKRISSFISALTLQIQPE